MDMQASRQLAVTQQQAWDALNDPEVLKACIPGCEKIESTGADSFTASVAVKIGPVSARFNGKVKLSDLNPPASYTLGFEGQGGAAGFSKGSAQVSLTPNDAGCLLAYTVHAQVGGKLAQIGQRLVDGAARSMAEDFFKRFDDEMQRRHPAPAAPAQAPAEAAVPAEPGPGAAGMPTWVWVGGAVVVLIALWWLTR